VRRLHIVANDFNPLKKSAKGTTMGTSQLHAKLCNGNEGTRALVAEMNGKLADEKMKCLFWNSCSRGRKNSQNYTQERNDARR
jgi:hypothetical protein